MSAFVVAEVNMTFLNFIALPMAFGIGAEYNVAQRYRDDHDMWVEPRRRRTLLDDDCRSRVLAPRPAELCAASA